MREQFDRDYETPEEDHTYALRDHMVPFFALPPTHLHPIPTLPPTTVVQNLGFLKFLGPQKETYKVQVGIVFWGSFKGKTRITGPPDYGGTKSWFRWKTTVVQNPGPPLPCPPFPCPHPPPEPNPKPKKKRMALVTLPLGPKNTVQEFYAGCHLGVAICCIICWTKRFEPRAYFYIFFTIEHLVRKKVLSERFLLCSSSAAWHHGTRAPWYQQFGTTKTSYEEMQPVAILAQGKLDPR